MVLVDHSPAGQFGLRDFDVLALVGSAGGPGAALDVLRTLPPDFDLPIVVALHLGPQSVLDHVYERLPFRVRWAFDGCRLQPGAVLLCPPRAFLTLLPDGRCALAPCMGALDKPLDHFLQSLAHRFGPRGIAVVLTGMGDDAAAGALALHRSGGRVLVQSEASAQHAAMPAAVVAAGAADIVVPLDEIGNLIGELHTRTPRMRMRWERQAVGRVFGHAGLMAAQAREVDWPDTPLGPVSEWPVALQVCTRAALGMPWPTALWWGGEFVQIHNDAWSRLFDAAPASGSFGQCADTADDMIWNRLGAQVRRVSAYAISEAASNQALLIEREGGVEEVFLSWGLAPLRDAQGQVMGVQVQAWDTTRQIVAERRVRLLQALAEAHAAGRAPLPDVPALATRAIERLVDDPQDIPFALLYCAKADGDGTDDELGGGPALCGCVGLARGQAAVLAAAACRPLVEAVKAGFGAPPPRWRIDDLATSCPGLALDGTGAAARARSALLWPLRKAAADTVAAVLVLGLSPYRPLDAAYLGFMDAVAQQVAALAC